MRRVLYDPERGYYSRRVRDVGRAGDFSTSATLSPLLGRAVARWIRAARSEMPRVRDVIEVGAGNGALMREVARQLGWWGRRGLRWHVVETSPMLRDRQQEMLAWLRPRWWRRLEEALAAAGGAALIFHNELLDAFPCRLFEWSAEHGWLEVWVRLKAGKVLGEETRGMHAAGADSPRFYPGHACALREWTREQPPPCVRQRVEVHEAVRDWLQAWAPHWRAGRMLCLDYGDVFPALYHRRPGGTLRGYFMQQRVEGPALYQNAGRQDVTADINFSDFRTWTEELGMRETFYGTLREWAARMEVRAESAVDARLLAGEGAGGAFKVVEHDR